MDRGIVTMKQKRLVIELEVEGDEAQFRQVEKMVKAFIRISNLVMWQRDGFKSILNARYMGLDQQVKSHSDVHLPKLSKTTR